jgi:hypothetical protein
MNKRWVKYPLALLCVFLVFIWNTPTASAFCGFFVDKTASQLHNSSSRVVIAHSGNRSIFSMANDYQGDVKDFARIVPIPVVPNRDQVRIGNLETVERLNAFTTPRLVEYIDEPCIEEINGFLMGVTVLVVSLPFVALVVALILPRRARRLKELLVGLFLVGLFLIGIFAIALPSMLSQANKAKMPLFESALNVTVEDKFTVGEYDVVILSAKQSNGLTTWLIQKGYKVPAGAQQMLQSYIAQGMKFFVVKVNLTEFDKSGYGFLRPIVLDYESPKFMLPIRLGTLNSPGEQDLIIHILSPDGYAEVSNYRTAPISTDTASRKNEPSGEELPYFLKEKDNFSKFYEAMFQQEYERQGKNVAFLEYAGAIGFGECDPCTVPQDEMLKLRELLPEIDPFNSSYVTRLHVRYTHEKFPKDLEFRIVGSEFDRFTEATAIFEKVSSLNIFQGRYVIRRPKSGASWIARLCYRKWNKRWTENLTRLTGWDKKEIGKMASR